MLMAALPERLRAPPAEGSRTKIVWPIVTVPAGFGFRSLVDDLLGAAGVSPRVSFESDDLATIEGFVGAGLGVRYYTPIGAVRLDVAVPINRPPDGDRFEFYIGLGQAF